MVELGVSGVRPMLASPMATVATKECDHFEMNVGQFAPLAAMGCGGLDRLGRRGVPGRSCALFVALNLIEPAIYVTSARFLSEYGIGDEFMRAIPQGEHQYNNAVMTRYHLHLLPHSPLFPSHWSIPLQQRMLSQD